MSQCHCQSRAVAGRVATLTLCTEEPLLTSMISSPDAERRIETGVE
jgi:hypothetical protein